VKTSAQNGVAPILIDGRELLYSQAFRSKIKMYVCYFSPGAKTCPASHEGWFSRRFLDGLHIGLFSGIGYLIQLTLF